MKLLVLSYPEIADHNLSFIQQIRSRQDPLFSVVAPHFTLVFPLSGFSEKEFADEIAIQVNNFSRFTFTIRKATLHKDEFTGEWLVFLIPHEGYSGFVQLHDGLYSGKLEKYHRRDIDYIPHLTVCRSDDKNHCMQLVDQINASPFIIQGQITAIDLVKHENNTVTTLKKINLQA